MSCEAWPKKSRPLEADVSLLLHATRLGNQTPEAPLPIELETLRPDLAVIEVSYDPPATWLSSEATARGCPVIDGLTILVEQTAIALGDWSGIEADRAAMREAAEEFLAI